MGRALVVAIGAAVQLYSLAFVAVVLGEAVAGWSLGRYPFPLGLVLAVIAFEVGVCWFYISWHRGDKFRTHHHGRESRRLSWEPPRAGLCGTCGAWHDYAKDCPVSDNVCYTDT